MFALTTGTIGLIAVGVLILTVSPRRQESPIAVSATTTPAASAFGAADGATRESGADGGRALDAVGGLRSPSALSSTVSTRPAALTESMPSDALATPIGDGRFALVTGLSLAGQGGASVDVRFASGRVMEAEVVSAVDDNVVLVALADSEPGHEIAPHQPSGHDMVTVMASPPITVAYADVDTLAVHEGTPVLDGDGALVGLCTRTRSGGRVRLLEINDSLVVATSDGR